MKRHHKSKLVEVTIVTCDRTGCKHDEFRSNSIPKVIDQQLSLAGWTVIDLEIKNTLDWERKYLCPDHRPAAGQRSIGGRIFRTVVAAGRRHVAHDVG